MKRQRTKNEEHKTRYRVPMRQLLEDSDISKGMVLLYGIIVSLCKKEGYCWASNHWLGKQCHVNKATISKWISILVHKNYVYITLIYRTNTKEIQKRKIFMQNNPPTMNDRKGYAMNDRGPMLRKPKDISISIINSSKKNTKSTKSTIKKYSPSDLMQDWNTLANKCNLPKARKLTTYKSKINTRLKEEPSKEYWKDVLLGIEKQPNIHTATWLNFEHIVRNSVNPERHWNVAQKYKAGDPIVTSTNGFVEHKDELNIKWSKMRLDLSNAFKKITGIEPSKSDMREIETVLEEIVEFHSKIEGSGDVNDNPVAYFYCLPDDLGSEYAQWLTEQYQDWADFTTKMMHVGTKPWNKYIAWAKKTMGIDDFATGKVTT